MLIFNSILILFKKLIFIWTLIVILFLLFTVTVKATHIKAGEITVRQLGTVEYQVTLTLYYDSLSIEDSKKPPGESLLKPTEDIDFGDGLGPQPVKLTSQTSVGNNTLKVIYQTTYNYGFKSGAGYLISFKEVNRNAYVVNIIGPGNSKASDGIAFHIETFISTFTELGDVATPILELPPVDNGTPNQIFTHNPGARPGIEGDSLSFKLIIPKQSRTQNVDFYSSPDDPIYGGVSVNGTPSTFYLNPTTGDITWDTPANYFPSGAVTPSGLRFARYNIAILVEEWKKYPSGKPFLYSSIVRDMQIEVKENKNHTPVLKIPKDTCFIVQENQRLADTIYVSDPDTIPNRQRIILQTRSEIYFPRDNPATINKSNPPSNILLNNPDFVLFNWKPSCTDVRNNPYLIYFRAADQVAESIRLSAYKTWQIKVIADKPKNFKATYVGNGFNLTWDPYYCNNADAIVIYRKDCSSGGIKTEVCTPLSFLNNGYKKIGSVSSKQTNFLDTLDIHAGTSYCYVSIASFTDRSPGNNLSNGLSIPSTEFCTNAYQENVLITQISVEKTDSISGKIRVGWKNFVSALPGANFEYRIFRQDTILTNNSKAIFISNNIKDSVFIDSTDNINTVTSGFDYSIKIFKDNVLYTSSDTASSVYLSVKNNNNSTILNWKYNDPWDNTKLKQLIFRKKISENNYTLIDSVSGSASNGIYNDNNISARDTFCYIVATKTRYCIDTISKDFINNSQSVCVIPIDSVPPCPPILSLIDENCNIPVSQIIDKPYKSFLAWKIDSAQACNEGLTGYNLYFAAHPTSAYQFIKKFPKDSLNFIYNDFNSQAGCFAVTALDNHSNESIKSNQECNDNCYYFELPNLITPNKKDTLNNLFRPYDFPRGVQQVQLYIYNRWGALVHFQDNDINLNWDPASLSDGIYYYLAKVTLERKLLESDEKKELKGWIQIIGNKEASSKF